MGNVSVDAGESDSVLSGGDGEGRSVMRWDHVRV